MKMMDIAIKDLIRSMRSMFALGMMVAAPLLMTGLIYVAFGGITGDSGDLPAVRVGVVNLDVLPAQAPLDAPLGDSIRLMFFDESVQSWIAAVDFADESVARQAVDRQEVDVAVIVPPSLTAEVLAGKQDTPVLMIQDPTLQITPQVVRTMLTSFLDGVAGGGIAYQTVSQRQEASGLTLDPVQASALLESYSAWYQDFQRNLFHNPERAALVTRLPTAESADSTSWIAGLIGLIMGGQMIFFAFFSGSNAMMSILWEQEEGTLARLFTTPTDRTMVLAGKFLAVFFTVVLQGVVLMAAGSLAFDIYWGRPAAVALALVGQVVAAVGLGVLIISFVKNSRQGGVVLGGGLSVLGMLGGLFTVAIPNAPAVLDTLAVFTPQGWVLKAWRIALSGGSAVEMLAPFAFCLLFGLVMFAVGALRFRSRFAA
jgi:ABC-2 type transport system permease protein